jgi:hypothetical protein
MATRPVFLPDFTGRYLVEERAFDFSWSSGFAEVQKKKNITALHETAMRSGITRILEISSKSSEKVGQRLSAFSLKIALEDGKYSLESVYQGAKVFENGGPFPEIFSLSPREAKHFIREGNYGRLIRFELEDRKYSLSPKNAFYDWLYIRSLKDCADWISDNIQYDAFTDIEFNPSKQVNCQARAFAEYVSLIKRDRLNEAVSNFEIFSQMLKPI